MDQAEQKSKMIEMLDKEKFSISESQSDHDAYGAASRAMGILQCLRNLGMIDDRVRQKQKSEIFGAYEIFRDKDKEKAIDRKFFIHAFSRSSNSLYTEREGVLFLARDRAFLETLPDYLDNCQKMGADEAQLESVRLLTERVKAYQKMFPNKAKLPDVDKEKEAYLFL